MFRFRGRYINKSTDSYYYPDWSKATPISVLAPDRDEAFKKVWALLGTSPHGRTWEAIWDSIDEEKEEA